MRDKTRQGQVTFICSKVEGETQKSPKMYMYT